MAKKELKPTVDFPFGRDNYIWMFAGIGLVFLGFILMSGGGTEDPAIWDPSIFDAQRITIAPLLVMAGFVVEIFAITKKVKE